MAVLAQVPVDRIAAQAEQMRFWRTVLLLLGALLYGAGRLAYRTCVVAWMGLAWCAAAVKLGWQDARKVDQERRAARKASS